MKNKKELPTVCVLGCGGFVGSHLVERLLDSGDYGQITGIDISDQKIRHLSGNSRFDFVKADAHSIELLRPSIEKSSTVISLVALCNPSLYTTIPLEVIDSNFTLPLEIVKLCHEYQTRLIHFSTSEVYGKTAMSLSDSSAMDEDGSIDRWVLTEDTSQLILGPVRAQRWSYACAKQLLERVIYAYGTSNSLEYTIVRPFNFIGPRMDFLPGLEGEGIPRVFACFMDALLFEKPLQLVDGGNNRRCFTYIDDAIDAVMAIIDNRESSRNQIFNIGNPDNEISIRDLASLMHQMYGEIRGKAYLRSSIGSISGKEFYGEGYDDSDRRIPDIRKAVDCLGWKPKTGLSQTIQLSMLSFIEHFKTVKNST